MAGGKPRTKPTNKTQKIVTKKKTKKDKK